MKKTYCYNCDKMVIPKKTRSKNKYKINDEYVEIDEDIFKCSNCDNEIIDVQGYDPIQNIYDTYLKIKKRQYKKLGKSTIPVKPYM